MQSRRILLAFSLAASTASVAFADMVDLSPAAAQDSLGQLTKTLSSGSYAHPDDMDIPATSEIKVSVGEKSNESVTLLNNASIEAKYGRNYSSNYSSNSNSYTSNANNYTASANNPYSSWLIAHPLPNSRVIVIIFSLMITPPYVTLYSIQHDSSRLRNLEYIPIFAKLILFLYLHKVFDLLHYFLNHKASRVLLHRKFRQSMLFQKDQFQFDIRELFRSYNFLNYCFLFEFPNSFCHQLKIQLQK